MIPPRYIAAPVTASSPRTFVISALWSCLSIEDQHFTATETFESKILGAAHATAIMIMRPPRERWSKRALCLKLELDFCEF